MRTTYVRRRNRERASIARAAVIFRPNQVTSTHFVSVILFEGSNEWMALRVRSIRSTSIRNAQQ